jgi:hypothetical protein
MKTCTVCKTEKELAEFASKGKLKSGLPRIQSCCRECQSIYTKAHYRTNVAKYTTKARSAKEKYKDEIYTWLFNYFILHPCIDCGESNPIVLEFDHVRDKKHNNISSMIRRGNSIDNIKAEINKCDVRCANCHRKQTAIRSNWKMLEIIKTLRP